MQQVKWKFKGIDVFFVSPKDKLTQAVLKQAARLKIDPKKHKVEIQNDYFTLNDTTAGCVSCNKHTADPELPAVQMVYKEDEVGPTPDDMRDMLGLLDRLSDRDSTGPYLDPDHLDGEFSGLVN